MAMVPSYISRSVAGSFDNEGVAIFALVFVFFLYVKVGVWTNVNYKYHLREISYMSGL